MDLKDIVLTISGVLFSAAVPTLVWAVMKLRSQAAEIRASDARLDEERADREADRVGREAAARQQRDQQDYTVERDRRRDTLADAFSLIDKLQGQIKQLQETQNQIRVESQTAIEEAGDREREANAHRAKCERDFSQAIGWIMAVQDILRQKKILVPQYTPPGGSGTYQVPGDLGGP